MCFNNYFINYLMQKKTARGNNACIEPDKYTAAVNDVITVTNCGEALPSQVTMTLDWGDGSKATSGATGTHKYSKAGTFTIKLMANGSPASEKIGSSEKIERAITIN
jgi:plastocyanin